MKQIFDQIVQIGLVVENAEKTAALFHDVYGLGPWQFYPFQGYRAAACNRLNLQFELIEPTQENDFARFLRRRGGTAVYDIQMTLTGDYDETCAILREKGHTLSEQRYPDGSRFVFCDTYDPMGVCIKFSESRTFDPRTPGEEDPAYPGGTAEARYPAVGVRPKEECAFAAVGHLCLSAENAMETMKIYNDEYGFGPWIIVNLNEGPIINRRVHGQLIPHVTTATNCFMSDVNYEINGGEDENSHYSEFVRKNGAGIHHIMMVPNWPEAQYLDFLTKERGLEIAMSGTMKASGDSFYYVDALSELGFCLETFSKLPSPEDPPEYGPPLLGTYPPQD